MSFAAKFDGPVDSQSLTRARLTEFAGQPRVNVLNGWRLGLPVLRVPQETDSANTRRLQLLLLAHLLPLSLARGAV